MTLKMTLVLAMVLPAVSISPARAAEPRGFVPFVIPHQTHPQSLLRLDPPPIAAAGDRIVVRDGHFYRAGKRWRVWGVNLCFGACFPRHADAKLIAQRLAAAGVNSVRFHHMDTAAFPRGIWDPRREGRLSAEALDRLDFFIDRLARRGIYSNINLHVSRTHSRAMRLPDPGTSYDKIVGIFTPALIEAQRDYARRLLGHVNPYRKLRHAADAAVAFVEITNEDSFFMWGGTARLRALPDYYAEILRTRHVAWLRKRYGSTAKLRGAWSAGAEPLGKNVLAPLPSPSAATSAWALEKHGRCAAELQAASTKAALRIGIRKTDGTNWHLQFRHGSLKLRAGGYYTVSFRARADRPRTVDVSVGQANSPWRNLGLQQGIRLTAAWQSFRVGFAAKADEADARVSFSVGASKVAVEFSDVQLRPGGRVGLADGEKLEGIKVDLFGAGETPARQRDRMRFLAETEKGYFDGLYAFLRRELGCKALITGTIVFGPLGMYAQSGMDYVDGHAYWHHPRFPGRPWDQNNWTVQQEAMVDHPERSTVARLSAQRLLGKPYTVSEYNHPAPNDYQAECVPLLAAFAAAQDWDGIWLFTYSHSADDWDKRHYSSFFDIDANPAKWGFMPAGAVLFRDAGLPPLKRATVVDLATGRDALGDLARLHLKHGRDMLRAVGERGKITWKKTLTDRIYVTLRKGRPVKAPPNVGTLPKIDWEAHGGRGKLMLAAGRAAVFVGPANGIDGLKHPAFVVLTTVSLDGRPLERSGKLLITACGRCENVSMGFSADRRTVGRNWGRPPVRIQAVTLVGLEPPHAGAGWRLTALGPDGRPAAEVPGIGQGRERTFELSPKYNTMWYLLTREPSPPPADTHPN